MDMILFYLFSSNPDFFTYWLKLEVLTSKEA